MCGIFAFQGPAQTTNAGAKALTGLKKLDYRGYDSWGVAVVDAGQLKVKKEIGILDEKKAAQGLPKSRVAMAHTRWATHGGVTQTNAHPHPATDNSFVLAQNGIVENFHQHKEELKAEGWPFKTQTDTEVIVRLIESIRRQQPKLALAEAVRQAFLQLKGRNTVIVLAKDGELIAARNGSPLVIGLTKNPAEIYFSSDVLSFAGEVEQVVVVENGQLASFQAGKLRLQAIKTGQELKFKPEKLNLAAWQTDKQGFAHFMVKEIHEAPMVVRTVAKQGMGKGAAALERLARAIKQAKTVYIIGSGTAGLAAAQMAFYLRQFARVPALSLVGAESQSYFNLFKPGDLMIALSQSGETADVLEVFEVAKARGVKLASLVNMAGSMINRMSDFAFMAEAGPELSVMSTKVFVAQLAWSYLVAKTVAGIGTDAVGELHRLAVVVSQFLDSEVSHQQLKKLAAFLKNKPSIFLLGKSQNLAICQEGMVKLIEGSYQHAHAIPAGDLKHFAITIMAAGVPVLVLFSRDEVRPDVISAAAEVRSRGATVIGLGQGGDDPEVSALCKEFVEVPAAGEVSAIANIVPLQLLAYYLTVALGHNVDKPRNIAKSVTVK